MDTGENIATVAMKLAITNVVKRYSGVAQQKNGFWLMEQALKGTLTPEFWIAEFEKDSPSKGKEIYDEMVQWYAKTNIQQHEETALEEQAKQIRKEAKEKIQGLRNQFLQAETTAMQDKHETMTEKKEKAVKLAENRRKPSEDEKILSILENYNLTPEQKADPVFMEPRNKRIAELKQKIAQAEPKT
jgi:hypothetical protein